MLELYVRMMVWIKKQEGQDLVEYALIAGLIAVVAFLAIQASGTSVSTIWSKIASELALAANPA